MTITSIQYKQKFPTFQFLNSDIGFEASLGESEDPLEALGKLKAIAEAFHKQEFPHLYAEEKSIVSAQLVGQRVTSEPVHFNQPRAEEDLPPADQIKGFYEIINSRWATSKALEQYRTKIEALGDEALTAAFNNRIKELQ